MKKILFSDLDRTLLNDKKEIEAQTRAAVDEMLSRGHIFTVCTGRPLRSAILVARENGLLREGCYIIAYNGGIIYDPMQDKMIDYASIPLPLVQKLFARASQAGQYIQTYGRGDTVLTESYTPELEFYVAHTKLPYRLLGQVETSLAEEPPKMIVINLEDKESLLTFQRENDGWAKEHMNSFFSSEAYLEYCPKGISKGTAAVKLCEYLGLPPSCAVAAGDERNDIPMLEACGVGAVPSNAYHEACARADYVCKKDNNEGAVGEMIHKFIL